MLEHLSFLILSWTAVKRGSGAASHGRDILDGDKGGHLGRAHPRVPIGAYWLRWLLRPALEIRELDDESLLFTLYRPWLYQRAWEVFDAEGARIGGLKNSLLTDRIGHPLASVNRLADGTRIRFLNATETELATLESTPAGPRLSLSASIDREPFLKMLLLAAALALTDTA